MFFFFISKSTFAERKGTILRHRFTFYYKPIKTHIQFLGQWSPAFGNHSFSNLFLCHETQNQIKLQMYWTMEGLHREEEESASEAVSGHPCCANDEPQKFRRFTTEASFLGNLRVVGRSESADQAFTRKYFWKGPVYVQRVKCVGFLSRSVQTRSKPSLNMV